MVYFERIVHGKWVAIPFGILSGRERRTSCGVFIDRERWQTTKRPPKSKLKWEAGWDDRAGSHPEARHSRTDNHWIAVSMMQIFLIHSSEGRKKCPRSVGTGQEFLAPRKSAPTTTTSLINQSIGREFPAPNTTDASQPMNWSRIPGPQYYLVLTQVGQTALSLGAGVHGESVLALRVNR
jgi:hypothetical protein